MASASSPVKVAVAVTPAAPAAAAVTPQAVPKFGESAVKDYYFDSYSHFGIHEEMLKDTVRTRAYMDAIMNNKAQFKDKVVLDIGCGTGILCMFAAKAGAKKVIGIECASIYHQAVEIVKENKLDHIITLVQAKVEDIVELPEGITQVDIIISEWMGYYLLYESMLDTVLYARDRWLIKDNTALILPDVATMHVAALEDREYRADKLDFWDSVYGLKMDSIKQLALKEPLVDVCESKQVISNSSQLLHIDLYTVTKEQLDFAADFRVVVARNDYLHGLICWFDIEFSRVNKKIFFSTGPHSKYTHWKQVVFYIDTAVTVNKADVITGRITTARNKHNPRNIDLTIAMSVKGGEFPFEMEATEYKLR